MLKSKFKINFRQTPAFRLEKLILSCSFAFCILNFTFTSLAQDEFIYDSKGKRNPFIPLVTQNGRLLKLDKQEGVEGLRIEGIIYDKHGLSYTIVNSEVVKVGDKVGDYQVLKIESNKVIFIKDAKPLEIELKKEEE
jgi:hypothetical protein